MVVRTAVRHRSEIGGIGLDQQPVIRNRLQALAHVVGAAERDDAGHAEISAERQKLLRPRDAPGEAVDHKLPSGLRERRQ